MLEVQREAEYFKYAKDAAVNKFTDDIASTCTKFLKFTIKSQTWGSETHPIGTKVTPDTSLGMWLWKEITAGETVTEIVVKIQGTFEYFEDDYLSANDPLTVGEGNDDDVQVINQNVLYFEEWFEGEGANPDPWGARYLNYRHCSGKSIVYTMSSAQTMDEEAGAAVEQGTARGTLVKTVTGNSVTQIVVDVDSGSFGTTADLVVGSKTIVASALTSTVGSIVRVRYATQDIGLVNKGATITQGGVSTGTLVSKIAHVVEATVSGQNIKKDAGVAVTQGATATGTLATALSGTTTKILIVVETGSFDTSAGLVVGGIQWLTLPTAVTSYTGGGTFEIDVTAGLFDDQADLDIGQKVVYQITSQSITDQLTGASVVQVRHHYTTLLFVYFFVVAHFRWILFAISW